MRSLRQTLAITMTTVLLAWSAGCSRPAPVAPPTATPAPAASATPPAAAAVAPVPTSVAAPTPPVVPVSKDTLVIHTVNEPEFIDPALATGIYEAYYIYNIFEGLVDLDKDSKLRPAIAERWDISPDQLVYTFHLRANAKWSDGRPVTAGDFAYGWERILNPATASQYAANLFYVKNAEAYNTGTLKDATQLGFRAIDDRTFEVTLAAPTPQFLNMVVHYAYFPAPKWAIEKGAQRWTQPEFIVSNGYFTPKTWVPNKEMLLEKNPHYWDAANVHINHLKLMPVADKDTALRMYDNNEIDVVMQVVEAKIPQLINRPDYHPFPFAETYYYRLNVTRKPFTDVRVRQALALAIDRTTLCDVFLKKADHPTATMVPEGMDGYKSPKGLEYDPERAKKLLTDAGFPGGAGLPTITILYNTDQRHKLVAEVIQQMWRQNLGVSVELLNQEWKTYVKSRAVLDYDVARSGWISDYVDPNSFLGDQFLSNSGNNQTGWKNALFDELIKRSNQITDPAARNLLLQQAEDILLQEAPVIPLFNEANRVMVKPDIKNFPANILGYIPLKGVSWGTPAAAAATTSSVTPPTPVAAPATALPAWRPSPDGFLRAAVGSEPATIDPGKSEETEGRHVLSALFEGLLAPDMHGKPTLALAESYTVSPDRLTYRFVLRPNLRWSDGKPLTAGDFAYAWERVLRPATASNYASFLYPIKNAEAYNKGTVTDATQLGFKTIDDRTVELTLHQPVPYFLHMLSYPTYYPTPRWAIDAHGERWTQPGNIVTSGPFTVTAWISQNEITVVKNPHYWNAANVKLPGIHFMLIESRATQAKMFEGGELDITRKIQTEQVPSYLGSPALQMGPMLASYYYELNTTRPPFNDVRVRQALNLAVDRKVLTEHFLKKIALPNASFASLGIPGYTPAPGLDYDPVRAKQLLAEAGFADPSKFPAFSIQFNTDETHRLIAQVVQQMWQQNLGIRAELRNVEWKTHLKMREAYDYDVARMAWVGDYPDPMTYLEVMQPGSTQNFTGWKDTQYDMLVKAGNLEPDPAVRMQKLQQAEARLLAEAPIVPLYTYMNQYLMRPEVKNFHMTLQDDHSFAPVYLDTGTGAAPSVTSAPSASTIPAATATPAPSTAPVVVPVTPEVTPAPPVPTPAAPVSTPPTTPVTAPAQTPPTDSAAPVPAAPSAPAPAGQPAPVVAPEAAAPATTTAPAVPSTPVAPAAPAAAGSVTAPLPAAAPATVTPPSAPEATAK